MTLSEFFKSAIEMAEAGNWGGIWTLILGGLTIVLGSVGGVSGLIAIVVKIFSLFKNKDKLLEQTKVFLEENVKPLKDGIYELRNQLQTLVEQNIGNIKQALQDELAKIQTQFDNIELEQKAFAYTALNTEELKLQYENFQKQFLLEKSQTQQIIEVSETEVLNAIKQQLDNGLDAVSEAVTDVIAEVEQISAETETALKSPKIKLKQKME